jgi:hypothetical protein
VSGHWSERRREEKSEAARAFVSLVFEVNPERMGEMTTNSPPVTQNDGNSCIEQARALALFVVLLYRANGEELDQRGKVHGMAFEDIKICIPNELRKGHFPYAACDGEDYYVSHQPTPSLIVAQEVVTLKAASSAKHSKISELEKEEA